MRVHVDSADPDTLMLWRVPLDADYFNKAHTNVLVKRPRTALPFLIFVDEDLEYTSDQVPALAALFAGGPRRDGWRVLPLARHTDVQGAVEAALTVLGMGADAPAEPKAPTQDAQAASSDGGLLAAFAVNATQKVQRADALPTVGRDDLIAEALAATLRWGEARLCLIVGLPGVGKSNLIDGMARRLAVARPDVELLVVSLGQLFAGTWLEAEKENLLARLLAEAAARPGAILALEHVELILASACGPLLLEKHLDTGGRLLGTTLPQHLRHFRREPLARRLHLVELPEASAADTAAVLDALAPRIADHHRIQIDKSCINPCIHAASPIPGCYPAKAITLLDAAAAAAALAGADTLALDDICLAADRIQASHSLADG